MLNTTVIVLIVLMAVAIVWLFFEIRNEFVFGIICSIISILVCLIPLLCRFVSYGGIYTVYEADATVVSVGYQGVCIKCIDEYGEDTITSNIKTNSTDEYNVGDTVAVTVEKNFFLSEPIFKIIHVKKADG